MIGRASLPSLFWWHYQSTYHFLFAKKANYISLVSVLILEQMKATPVELTEATPVRVPWRPILSRPLGPSAAQPAAAQSVSRAL